MDKTTTPPIGNPYIRCDMDPTWVSKGPSLRLSWPNANDSRRAIVAKSQPSPAKDRGRYRDTRIVLVSHGDLETHYQLASPRRNGPTLQIPMEWNPVDFEVGESDLFQYFQSTACQALAIFPHDPVNLGGALVRIALSSHDTKSARAVQRSLLAFASIHRHIIYSQAVELKISALEALASATKESDSIVEAIQNIATGMLICSFEIHQISCTSGHWIHYLDGIREVIKAFGLDDPAHRHGDVGILLDWFYYHEVLARLTQQYWHSDAPADSSSPRIHGEAFDPSPSTMEIPELLAKVCDAVSAKPPPTAPTESLEAYKSFLRILDWRIRNIKVTTATNESVDTVQRRQAYKLAISIYLNRATGNILNHAPRTEQQIDEAFAIFSQLSSCPRQFPVFIIGCEARTDTRRAIVLDLMARTERTVASRSFKHNRILMEAIWAQDDLANGEINYQDKLSGVFQRCANLPTLV
ncbi:hypothetical protein M426DRAFT_13936 [Hypoxylon sp. CI-4A]|nr:hypothetical protein M426DRAFT_13936 [Hypoxylon sp. CI-4A]